MADASDEETVRFVPGVVSATHVSSGSDHLKSSLLAIICTLEAHHRLKELSLTGSKARSEKLESNDSPSIPRPESGRVGGRLLLIAAVLSRITELYDSQTVRDCTAPEHLQLLAELYSFFTLLRACLDDVALSITVFSKREGQLPTRFSRLIDLYQKKPHRFEPHIATALSADMSWFRHMRSIRDTLVHGYAQSIIYADETLMFDLIKDQPSGQVQRMFDGDKRRLGIDILDLTAHYVQATYSLLEHVGYCLIEHVKTTWPGRIRFYYEACLQGRVVRCLVASLNRDLSQTKKPWKSSERSETPKPL